jgi:hypothetical protein
MEDRDGERLYGPELRADTRRSKPVLGTTWLRTGIDDPKF